MLKRVLQFGDASSSDDEFSETAMQTLRRRLVPGARSDSDTEDSLPMEVINRAASSSADFSEHSDDSIDEMGDSGAEEGEEEAREEEPAAPKINRREAFQCQVCPHVLILSEADLQAHEQSKKHLSRVAALERLVAEESEDGDDEASDAEPKSLMKVAKTKTAKGAKQAKDEKGGKSVKKVAKAGNKPEKRDAAASRPAATKANRVAEKDGAHKSVTGSKGGKKSDKAADKGSKGGRKSDKEAEKGVKKATKQDKKPRSERRKDKAPAELSAAEIQKRKDKFAAKKARRAARKA